jgi:hypothetical protein
MIRKFIKWFISPSQKPVVDANNVYDKLLELEQRIEKLEHENVETSNCIYELSNSIDAVDRRIDIVAENPWKEQFNV